jgi:hypothetical protein
MLTYLEANLHPERLPADFAAAIRNSHVVRANVASGMRIAFAWIKDESDGTYWHNGLISGYTSYAFFRPAGRRAGDRASLTIFLKLCRFPNLVGEHIRQRLAGAPAASLASITVPANDGFSREFAGSECTGSPWPPPATFIFCCVLGLQGVAAQVLPRRWFLRISSFLQLAVFGTMIAVYFTQPIIATPDSLSAAQGSGPLFLVALVLVPRIDAATARIARAGRACPARVDRAGDRGERHSRRLRALVFPHAAQDRGRARHHARRAPVGGGCRDSAARRRPPSCSSPSGR